MFAHGQLTRCLEHKATLLRQSAAHRSVLAREAQNVRPVAGWMDLSIAVARKARAVWTALVPLFSLGQTRAQESPVVVGKLSAAISLARSLAALWKRRQ